MGDVKRVSRLRQAEGLARWWRFGGPPKQVTHLDSGEIFDIHWSGDGRQLALTRGSESSDAILIRGFR
jgi:hypothetical protein